MTKRFTKPSVHGENCIVCSDIDKTIAFADILEETFQPDTSPATPQNDKIVRNCVTSFLSDEHGRGRNIASEDKEITKLPCKLKPPKITGV